MKILASDFDNTLYIKDEKTFKQNLSSLKKFISAGNIFCIITGRSYSNIKILLNEYQIPYSYLICQDGAKIFNNMDYCINTVMLDEKTILKIKEVFNENNTECLLEDGYNTTNNLNDCVKVLAKYKNLQTATKIVEELQEKTSTNAYISTEHINVTAHDANKKTSIETLISLEKLPSTDIYVIGDSINDYDMLKEYKGAIMKNHHPILDNLSKKEYETFYEYIEELMKY